ncbi:MAG TPA: hypothetical protein VGG48_07965 [Rhizomicrobium sp.]|jgi:hypothetical protein
MTSRQDRDDRLVGQIRSGIRAEGRVFGSLLIAALLIAAISFSAWKFHLPVQTAGLAALSVLILWIVFVYSVVRAVPPGSGNYDEAILRRTIDDQQRRWRWYFLFMFIVIGCLAAVITGTVLFLAGHSPAKSGPLFVGHSMLIPGPQASVLGVAVDLALFAIVAAFQVCFGPGFLAGARRRALNDEHTRALQHSAAMFGYLLSVIVMCAVFGAMAIRPQWGLVAMPGALAASVILPGLYFLILQWRAGHDG